MFDTDGMDDLSEINNESLQGLVSDTPELLCWTDQESMDFSLNMKAIPQDQLVLPISDINIRSIDNIDSFTLNVTTAGQGGAVTTAVSFDKGATWYTRSLGEWAEIDLENLKIDGMIPATLTALSFEEWTELRGISDTIRFAYHLSLENMSDTLAVNDLISHMDMKGTWKKAIHGTHYDYEYPNNDLLLVTIYTDGDYKINY